MILFLGWLAALEEPGRRRYIETLTPAPAGWEVTLIDWWLHPANADSDATEAQLEEAYVALDLG